MKKTHANKENFFIGLTTHALQIPQHLQIDKRAANKENIFISLTTHALQSPQHLQIVKRAANSTYQAQRSQVLLR